MILFHKVWDMILQTTTPERDILASDYDSSAIADLVRLGQQATENSPSGGTFNIHGVSTRTETNSGEVARALSDFLGIFPGSDTDEPDIRAHLFTVESLDQSMGTVPADATMLYDWGSIKIYHLSLIH